MLNVVQGFYRIHYMKCEKSFGSNEVRISWHENEILCVDNSWDVIFNFNDYTFYVQIYIYI